MSWRQEGLLVTWVAEMVSPSEQRRRGRKGWEQMEKRWRRGELLSKDADSSSLNERVGG